MARRSTIIRQWMALAALALSFVFVGQVLAWENSSPPSYAPSGSSTWWHNNDGVVSYADMTWSQAGVDSAKQYFLYFDWTADCDAATPEPDQLHSNAHLTSIPNFGVLRYNDCGASSSLEEIELDIAEKNLVAGTGYYWQVFWNATKTGHIDGEINISMERGIIHDWLEKEQYWYQR